MRSLEVTNNDYGDPWIWMIRDETGREVGMVVPASLFPWTPRFVAIDGETNRRASGADQRDAVIHLYEKLGETVRVSVAPDLTETGISTQRIRWDKPQGDEIDFDYLANVKPDDDKPIDLNRL